MSAAAERDREMDEQEAADYLGVSRHTLRKLRLRGEGPKCFTPIRRVHRYRVSDLDAWKASRTRGADA